MTEYERCLLDEIMNEMDSLILAHFELLCDRTKTNELKRTEYKKIAKIAFDRAKEITRILKDER